jgi:uncharacterized protein (DUF885 family)
MSRYFRAALALLFVLVAVTAQAKKKSAGVLTFHEMSMRVLDSLESFDPAVATEMGIHAYDRRLADYSSSSVNRMISSLEKLRTRLNAFGTTNLKPNEKIDLRLLNSNIEVALLNLKGIGWYKRSPYLYVDEAIDGLYFLMLSRHANTQAKLPTIIARMSEVSGLFATAQKNLRNVPRVYIESAQEGLRSGRDFYLAVGKQLADSFPRRSSDIQAAVNKATAAMDDFSKYLSNLKPGPDTAFAIGKVNYNYLLSHQYFLPYDADSLLKIGEGLLKQAITEYSEYQAYVESNRQTGQDSVFIPKSFTRADFMDYYGWEVNQVKAFIKMDDILTVPDYIAPVIVVETPAFLRPMIGGIAYQPAGPFDDHQQGMFYVRPVPDSLDRAQLDARYRYVHRRGFRGSIVHEAFPGHHLQMQLAGHVDDPVRKWQMNNMMIEGWALYCEEMMYHAGLFGNEDPAQWLGILGGVRFRAARIVADVKLHTGQFTYDQCVNWMCKTLESQSVSDSNYIRTEVRRYTHEPTQPMCYLTGKREIQRLFEAMVAKQGVDFDEKEFYDALLAEGSIPPALMWEIMDVKPVPESGE